MKKNNKIIIQIAHITRTPGPVQFLADYLRNKTENFYRIYHPLESIGKISSVLMKGDKIIKEKKARGNIFSNYIANFFISLKWLKEIKEPIDLAIGMNCFDVFPLIIMKKRCRIKKIFFFNTDFSRHRFKNFSLNKVYVWLDKFCAKKADLIGCNTKRTILKRIKEGVNNLRCHNPFLASGYRQCRGRSGVWGSV